MGNHGQLAASMWAVRAMSLSAIDLGVFVSRVSAVCDEMGLVLRHAAFSPNIKDRLDFSCALFDEKGELFAQAAHIPVHLGSMAFAMADIVATRAWAEGDVLAVNDPFLGGTHLPDVTLISPVYVDGEQVGFVANRAHHANIGAKSPGSMPLSTSLDEEGLIIPPTLLVSAGEPVRDALYALNALSGSEVGGDFAAQMSANRRGEVRLQALVRKTGLTAFRAAVVDTNDYAERLARAALQSIPEGEYSFSDVMDDDGAGTAGVALECTVRIDADGILVDLERCADQVPGNTNCPPAVAAAAVFYAFRCLLPADTPACAGTFRVVTLRTREGSIVNARRPAAVAAGNVETSMRLVDIVLGALAQALPTRIPAASQGTMNNVAMGDHVGNRPWDYYETIGGGAGAHATAPGRSAVQSHMTNTLNTPIESLEMHYPLRVTEYSLRRGSGGAGEHQGGDGIVREFEFLAPAEVTLLSERRESRPWGLAGGGPAAAGRNLLDGLAVAGKATFTAAPGQRLRLETPGGGGYGPRDDARSLKAKPVESG